MGASKELAHEGSDMAIFGFAANEVGSRVQDPIQAPKLSFICLSYCSIDTIFNWQYRCPVTIHSSGWLEVKFSKKHIDPTVINSSSLSKNCLAENEKFAICLFSYVVIVREGNMFIWKGQICNRMMISAVWWKLKVCPTGEVFDLLLNNEMLT